jgi:ribonuclease BN (tRNA processing enzyme)
MRVDPTAPSSSPAPARLILLGTAGGPRPNRYRASPAQVLLIDGEAHVIDCGYGVARQLVLAGVPLTALRCVYLTHHHSDHNADFGTLVWLAWASGLRAPVTVFGPPPLAEMRELFLRLHAYDIAVRTADEGRVPFAPLFQVREVAAPGVVLETARLRVTIERVHHPPVEPALAYRFDTPERAVVISGDTTYCPALVALARDADLLVHEAMYVPALERLVGRVGNARRQLEHLLASHTPAADAGRVAAEAGARTLVLSHLVPCDDPTLSDTMWLEEAQRHYDGPVVIGRDLLAL